MSCKVLFIQEVEIIIGLQVLTGMMNPRHKIPTLGIRSWIRSYYSYSDRCNGLYFDGTIESLELAAMKYYLIVGEARGDLHASNLMKALQAKDSKAEFRFFGGDLMAAAGGSLVKHYKDMAYMGFIPVLLHCRTNLLVIWICARKILFSGIPMS